jgi:hypothetical protein
MDGGQPGTASGLCKLSGSGVLVAEELVLFLAMGLMAGECCSQDHTAWKLSPNGSFIFGERRKRLQISLLRSATATACVLLVEPSLAMAFLT